MWKNNFSEFVLPLALIVVLLTLVVPLGLTHDQAMVMAQQGFLLAGFTSFALLVWRERVSDEREQLHRMMTGRSAYLVASGILIVGIVAESLGGQVDRWLVFALIAMVLTKIIGSVFMRLRR